MRGRRLATTGRRSKAKNPSPVESRIWNAGGTVSDNESVRVRDFKDNAGVRSGHSNHQPIQTYQRGCGPGDFAGLGILIVQLSANGSRHLAPSVPGTHDEETRAEALKKHVSLMRSCESQ